MPSTNYSYKNCTEVTPACPVEATFYGYLPSVPGNAAFAFIFAVCFFLQLWFGIRYKTKSYAIAVVLGCFIECVGYISRLMLHHNPWKRVPLSIQIVTLVIAPAFLAAGIYLTLKHIVLAISPAHSRIAPRLYTWIFISCDILSILIQAAGSAVASRAVSGNSSDTGLANDILMTGICFQVVTLLIFGFLAGLYARNVYNSRSSLPARAYETIQNSSFRTFVYAMSAAYLFILIRCIYRIGEMAGGWKNKISRNQTDFMVLDGLMCILAAIAMTFAHPGIWFPKMQQHKTVSNPSVQELELPSQRPRLRVPMSA